MKLGRVQRDVLEMVSAQSVDAIYSKSGVALYAMLALRGEALKYKSRYMTAVAHAVKRHNAGVCEQDCPLPRDSRVASGPVGPRGGHGYYVC